MQKYALLKKFDYYFFKSWKSNFKTYIYGLSKSVTSSNQNKLFNTKSNTVIS